MSQELALDDPIIKPRAPCKGVGVMRDPNNSAENPDDTNAQSNRLFSILSWKRPFDSAAEEVFAQHYIDTAHKNVVKDAFSNRHLHISYADGTPCKVMWSCHIDTCHHDEGYQRLALQKDKDGVLYVGVRKGEGSCLGADDGTGVWLLLEMIRKGKPGYYIFHRGEERGCLGSKWLKENQPDFLRGFEAAIALDRRGFDNIITHQGGERGCSEAFARAIGRQITGYKPDPTGAFTDTRQYFAHIPECTNLSVGYDMQHGPLEKQYVTHALSLRKSLLAMDLRALPIIRDPKKVEYRYGNTGHNSGGFQRVTYNYDRENKDPDAATHDACGSDEVKRLNVWSVEEKCNCLRGAVVFVSGRGYVLKSKLRVGDTILPSKRDKEEAANDTAALTQDNDVTYGADEEDDAIEAMLRDSGKTLLQLCKDYPGAAASLMMKAKVTTFDFLCEVYGEDDYWDFAIDELDNEDEAQDAAAGITPADEDATPAASRTACPKCQKYPKFCICAASE